MAQGSVKSYVERVINLTANTLFEYHAVSQNPNLFIIRNPSNTTRILFGDDPLTGLTRYQTFAEIDGGGFFTRPFHVPRLYLIASQNIPMVTVTEVEIVDPAIFMMQGAKPVGNDVNVVSTVGLRPANLNLDGLGNVGVNIQNIPNVTLTGSIVPAAVTLQNAAAANANGSNLTVTGLGTVVLTVTGTFSAVVNFESSIDGTNWFPHLATKIGDGFVANATTTTGQYRLNVAGVDLVRARVSGFVSGAVTVIGKASVIVAPSKAVQVAGRKLRVGRLQTVYGTQVDAGAISTVTITPTAGHIGRLLSLGYFAPAVAGSTGSHAIIVNIGAYSGTTVHTIQTTNIAGTSALGLFPWTTADGYKMTVFDVTNPLLVSYIAPGTNPQTGTRSIFVLWEEEPVI